MVDTIKTPEKEQSTQSTRIARVARDIGGSLNVMEQPDTAPPSMPLGKFRGQPLTEMTTPYLMWLLSQDAIRFKYRLLMAQALEVLRGRFQDFDKLVAELTPKGPVPEYWKIRAPSAAIRLQRTVDRLRRERPPAPAKVNAEPPPGVLMDASYFVRQARQKQAEQDDFSDLV